MMTPAQIRALKELLPIVALIVIVFGLIGGAIYYINVSHSEPTPVNVQITQNITIEHLDMTPIDFDYDFDIDFDYDIEITNDGWIPPGQRKK